MPVISRKSGPQGSGLRNERKIGETRIGSVSYEVAAVAAAMAAALAQELAESGPRGCLTTPPATAAFDVLELTGLPTILLSIESVEVGRLEAILGITSFEPDERSSEPEPDAEPEIEPEPACDPKMRECLDVSVGGAEVGSDMLMPFT
jgi:hypothetical protein